MQPIFSLFFLLLPGIICVMMLAFCRKNGLPNHMQNPRNTETWMGFHDVFSVSLHSYFILSSTISHCSLATDCPNTGFTMKGAKRNGEDIREPDILDFPREWEQDKPKLSVIACLFWLQGFWVCHFPEKSILSTKAVQQETPSQWTSLSELSLYLKFLAALRLICVKTSSFAVTFSALLAKLLFMSVFLSLFHCCFNRSPL